MHLNDLKKLSGIPIKEAFNKTSYEDIVRSKYPNAEIESNYQTSKVRIVIKEAITDWENDPQSAWKDAAYMIEADQYSGDEN
jgi:hypothetical protein